MDSRIVIVRVVPRILVARKVGLRRVVLGQCLLLPLKGSQLHLQVVVFSLDVGLLLELRARRGCMPLGQSWMLLGSEG